MTKERKITILKIIVIISGFIVLGTTQVCINIFVFKREMAAVTMMMPIYALAYMTYLRVITKKLFGL